MLNKVDFIKRVEAMMFSNFKIGFFFQGVRIGPIQNLFYTKTLIFETS
jgi:hypothetical protein